MTDNDDKSLFSTEELNKNQKIYADFWVNVRQIVSIKNHHSTANRKLGKFPRMKGSTDVTVRRFVSYCYYNPLTFFFTNILN
jgi:hypothetical protein